MPKVSENKTQQHTISFSAVLKHSEISKSFHDYLQKENKNNNWDFILATQVLNSHIEKGNYQYAIGYMKYIIHTFLELEKKNLQFLSENSKEIKRKIKKIFNLITKKFSLKVPLPDLSWIAFRN